MGHIRAATDGELSESNAHPFQYGPKLLFMHNGGIPTKVRARVKQQLKCEAAMQLIRGDTDTEVAGALFAQYLDNDVCNRAQDFEVKELSESLSLVIQSIENAAQLEPFPSASSLNFAATDGRSVVITRYRSANDEDPPSLYFSISPHDVGNQLQELFLEASQSPVGEAVQVEASGRFWVASEPLDGAAGSVHLWPRSAADNKTHGSSDDDKTAQQYQEQRIWLPVPKDCLLSYDSVGNTLGMQCLSAACTLELQHRLQLEGGHSPPRQLDL